MDLIAETAGALLGTSGSTKTDNRRHSGNDSLDGKTIRLERNLIHDSSGPNFISVGPGNWLV